MSFLYTWAFALAALAPIIVLLYLLKLRRRPLTVSTLLFWEQVLGEKRRRALFHRLRNWLSLLLHLLIFALLLLALARPVFEGSVESGTSTVLVIDTRARMQALEENGESRLNAAVSRAVQLLGSASESRQFALITAASKVVAPFTGDEAALREAAGQLRASDAAGDLDEAVSLARKVLHSRGADRRVIVLTEPKAAATLKTPSDIQTDVIAVGTARENAAITQFSARALPNSPETIEVVVEVGNFTSRSTTLNVEVAEDGEVRDVRPIALAAGEVRTEILPLVARPRRERDSRRGWLTARIDHKDALPLDNLARAVLPGKAPRRVLLISKGNWFLEKALLADAGVQFEMLAPDSFRPNLASSFDVTIFDNYLPPSFDPGAHAGNYLFVDATPFAASPAADLENPAITEVDTKHPLLRLVEMLDVRVLKSRSMTVPAPSDGWRYEAPIRSGENPLLIAGSRPAGGGLEQRLVALPFSPAESDLPLRMAFPLMMSNIVHWLASGERPPRTGLKAGEVLRLDPGSSVSRLPSVDGLPQAGAESHVSGIFQPSSNGFYHVRSAGGESWLAVNTSDSAESDLRAPSAPALRSPAHSIPLLHAPRSPLWQLLALAAVILLGLEWWLFHQRRTE